MLPKKLPFYVRERVKFNLIFVYAWQDLYMWPANFHLKRHLFTFTKTITSKLHKHGMKLCKSVKMFTFKALILVKANIEMLLGPKCICTYNLHGYTNHIESLKRISDAYYHKIISYFVLLQFADSRYHELTRLSGQYSKSIN